MERRHGALLRSECNFKKRKLSPRDTRRNIFDEPCTQPRVEAFRIRVTLNSHPTKAKFPGRIFGVVKQQFTKSLAEPCWENEKVFKLDRSVLRSVALIVQRIKAHNTVMFFKHLRMPRFKHVSRQLQFLSKHLHLLVGIAPVSF